MTTSKGLPLMKTHTVFGVTEEELVKIGADITARMVGKEYKDISEVIESYLPTGKHDCTMFLLGKAVAVNDLRSWMAQGKLKSVFSLLGDTGGDSDE